MAQEHQLPIGPFQKVICLGLGQEQKLIYRNREDQTEEDDQEDTGMAQERQLPAGPFQKAVCLCLEQEQKINYRKSRGLARGRRPRRRIHGTETWYRKASFPLGRSKKLYAFA